MQKLSTNQSGYWPEPEVQLVPCKMDTTKRRYTAVDMMSMIMYSCIMIVYGDYSPTHPSFFWETVYLKHK